ncbi:protein unc-13 homolog 4B isoform X1 [Halyomorpha halys]|uniref:protein unc-13 homolog 4B isoform X1 n=1 Tax=Halyomorpha halys TaxID=286706 RepID=UPI0006D4DCC0|nr:protein unc-13 homolog 4B isoform X2 [Halyomorpha halys]
MFRWPLGMVRILLQEFDGGFFEKFGTLLNDQVKQDEEAVVAEQNVGVTTDEEPEPVAEEEKRVDLIDDVVALNIDELYEEVIYEILHSVGADASVDKSSLFNYVKDLFKIDDDKHDSAYKEAQDKEAPNIVLNVEVVQARELDPKDANGLSDPFCTLYLTSKSTHRYNTSVKPETLNPLWQEYFSLPVQSTADDVLVLEVWDFDPAETVKEKMTKITSVQGIKGLRKLMKEIAVTASTGKHDNEMIGYVNIPLKCIPSLGHEKWYPLEKKSKSRGEIKLKLTFSSEKNSVVAFQEGRHIIRLLLLHEVENKNIDPKEWDGEFPELANTILRQHTAQSGLQPADEYMARWLEFIRFHSGQPFCYSLFLKVLDKIIQPLKNGLYSDEEVKLFWESTKRILPLFFQHIRKLRKLSQDDNNFIEGLTSILKILSLISSLNVPDNFELFPKTSFGWLSESSCSEQDIVPILKETIKQSAAEWYDHILENNKPEDFSNEKVLQQAVKVIQLVRNDIQKGIEIFDKHFYLILGIQYAAELYQIYDTKVCELVEPCVKNICSALKPINFDCDVNGLDDDHEVMSIGTSLFELYLILQKFLILGDGMFPTNIGSLHVSQFHLWFQKGVAHWLDIAVYKAIMRINKAIELDNLKPVDDSVTYSSSAVDTLSIFYQIKVFWTQLAWPDVEGNYTFVAKIIDDICRCCVHFADKMGTKVETLGESESVYGKKFEVTNEWCLAINNIDYIRQSIEPFVTQLGTDDLLTKLSDLRNPKAAEHCKQTLKLVVENALDNVRNKIIDLLEKVSLKMSPNVKRFLLGGGEILNQGNNHMDRLINYLDDNLTTLNSQLNSDNFEKILAILWDKIYSILNELIQDSLEKKRPSSFFANMDGALEILVGFFKQSENLKNNESYITIRKLLRFHGMETDELIQSYYLERLKEQKMMKEPTMGMLTIRAQFVNYMLRIEVLNARNLIPHDKNGLCDPYVKIHLLPKEKFADVIKPKTKTQRRNLFPLFDDTFTLQLSKEQKETKNGLVHFIMKDQDFISSEFMAEAFLSFSDIPQTTLETSIHEMAQVHLILNKPTNFDSDIIKAIDHRQGEKQARDFVKDQKTKMQSINDI